MKIFRRSWAFFLLLVFTPALRAEVTSADFGKARDGTAVSLFTITNKPGSSVRIMTYGATVVSIKVPDRTGHLDDVVLGFDALDGYLQRNNPYFGAIVGRYANRIRGAAFSLDGAVYKITANDRANTLHGGRRGFDKVVWSASTIDDHTVEFTYLSKDGEEGFPGNLTAHVRYSFSDSNELKIDYTATTDKNTVVNLTNHSYFNLAGAGNGDVLNHELLINADQFTPVKADSIPTGKLADVAGTPLDFRVAHKIADHLADDDPQLHLANGYDHNFVLNKPEGGNPDEPRLLQAASVYEPTSGRVMEIMTTQPGLQFYTSNWLDGSIAGKDGKKYVRHAALCLEPQHFPDSPNQPQFPSAQLKVGETYHSSSIYKFSARQESRLAAAAAATAAPTAGPTAGPSIDLATGWTLLQQGQAQGTIEQDARLPTHPSPHLLRISLTKSAEPGEGRAGAASGISFAISDGEWCDVGFSAATERGSIGLVFSLENADGKVLARTTLPEIGGGRGRGRGRGAPATAAATPPTTAPAPAWPKYLVSLHVRASDSGAHLVITPIEPTTVWLDGLTLTHRGATN